MGIDAFPQKQSEENEDREWSAESDYSMKLSFEDLTSKHPDLNEILDMAKDPYTLIEDIEKRVEQFNEGLNDQEGLSNEEQGLMPVDIVAVPGRKLWIHYDNDGRVEIEWKE